MGEKSHVSMENKVCPVCGIQHRHDCGVLLDTRIDRSTGMLRQSLERDTVTGWGLCEEHDKLFKDDFIALVAVDPEKSCESDGKITPQNAWRLGPIAHLRREVFNQVFDQEAPPGKLVFVELGVIELLQKME